jgi:hypothetical protein
MTSISKGQGLHRNLMSYMGLVVVAVNAALIVATLLWGFALKAPSPYLGIFTFMIFPAGLGAGIILFLWGMIRESRRRKRLGTTEALPYPRVDLNDRRHRRLFIAWSVGGTLLAILMGFVGYNAFIFTESVTFCGKLCHTVMEPEHSAYLASPHARVTCVQCHVGHGVDWYVKSKVSGLRQVWKVLTNSYERPIAVPIKNLRPARETCEECHWPEKFYGAQLQQNPHFRYDEANTAEQISLLIKTGGGTSRLGQSEGIHWHTVIDNRITFAVADAKQQTIPWIEAVGRDGRAVEYIDRTSPLSREEMDRLPKHVLDCMDCHNRPTHIYQAPENGVDRVMLGRPPLRTLPWFKKIAVDALTADYPDREAAAAGIRGTIEGFYRERYPEVTRSRKTDIESGIEAAILLYSQSVFPKMKVNWNTYASNIGHRNWPGCFRCHDGNHAAPDGRVLSRECTVCHTMPQRSALLPLGAAVPETSNDWHPMPLAGRHAEILCNACHAAGYRPPLSCGECHKIGSDAPMMASMECTDCHAKPGLKFPVADCRSCHEKPKGLHAKGMHPDAECTDCHKPHRWTVGGRNACLGCHEDRKDHNAPGACADCHDFKA